jgi:hypothetical protein
MHITCLCCRQHLRSSAADIGKIMWPRVTWTCIQCSLVMKMYAKWLCVTTFMFLMMQLMMKMTTRIMTFCWPKANDISSSLSYGYILVDSVACSSHTLKICYSFFIVFVRYIWHRSVLLSCPLHLAMLCVAELSVTFGNAACCWIVRYIWQCSVLLSCPLHLAMQRVAESSVTFGNAACCLVALLMNVS